MKNTRAKIRIFLRTAMDNRNNLKLINKIVFIYNGLSILSVLSVELHVS